MIRPRPRIPNERIIVRLRMLICSSRPSRLWATWNRQRIGDPGRRTSRSTTRRVSVANWSLL
jgi:hypothetical protein